MGDFLKNINWKHVLIMCIGNVFAGMGIGIFKLAGLGTDPFSGMNMAVADMIGMAYGNFQLIVNIVLLIIEIAFGRRFLGIGTVVNAVCLAYITTFFYNIYTGVFGLELVALPVRLVALCVGVVICCLGLSMYQMPDEGVAPYDSLSLIMTERWPKIPYFWHRMSNDVLCALICYLTGGGVGIGKAINGGFGMVCDGSERVDEILRSAMLWDVMGGVARRSWARNGHAMETSEEFNRTHADGYHITMPYVADDELVNKYIS